MELDCSPLSYLVPYLRRRLGDSMFNFLLYLKFSSGIHSNHCSNSSIPPKHLQNNWSLSSRWGQFLETGDWIRKSPTAVVCQCHDFASTQGCKTAFCSPALVQFQTFFRRRAESSLLQIKTSSSCQDKATGFHFIHIVFTVPCQLQGKLRQVQKLCG